MIVVAVMIVEVITFLTVPCYCGGARQGRVSAHDCVIIVRGLAYRQGRPLFAGSSR